MDSSLYLCQPIMRTLLDPPYLALLFSWPCPATAILNLKPSEQACGSNNSHNMFKKNFLNSKNVSLDGNNNNNGICKQLIIASTQMLKIAHKPTSWEVSTSTLHYSLHSIYTCFLCRLLSRRLQCPLGSPHPAAQHGRPNATECAQPRL